MRMTTPIDADRFIHEVKIRPTIWNVHSLGYANKKKKTKAWEEICRILQPDYDLKKVNEKNHLCRSMQRRWRSYRDCFVREVNIQKKEARLGKVNPNRRKYVFFDKLTFLRPYGQRSSIFTKFNEKTDDDSDTKDEDLSSDQEESGKQCTEEQSLDVTASTTQNSQPERMDKNTSEKDSTKAKSVDETPKCSCDEKDDRHSFKGVDEDKLFLLSLFKDLKKVPEENKLYAKTEIMLTLQKWQKSQARIFRMGASRTAIPSPTISNNSQGSTSSNSSRLMDSF